MALFKKKAKAIPEPPKIPPYPEAEEMKVSIKHGTLVPEEGLPELPELPESEEGAEEIVEEIESEMEAEEAEEKPKVKGKLVQELGERPLLPKTGKKMAREIRTATKEPEKAKALFIKIDKFKEILASVELMEKKASELENIIQGLKEVRAKEEQLLSGWNQELEELKTKIVSVERALSEKIE